MKVTLEFSGCEARPGATFRVKLPASWGASPVSRVKELFVGSYQKKHGDAGQWVGNEPLHVVGHDGRQLPDASTVSSVVKEHDCLRVMRGPAPESLAPAPPPPSATAGGTTVGAEASPTHPMCRNYGCQKRFDPAANGDDSCAHHAAGPTFRDGNKVWPCCGGSSWDWDGFLALPACAKGRHSTADPQEQSAALLSPHGLVSGQSTPSLASNPPVDTPPSTAKSIASFNSANPHAPTAAASVARTVTAALATMSVCASATEASSPAPESAFQPPRPEDGRVKCRRVGCGLWFTPAGDASCASGPTADTAESAEVPEDGPSSCRYHACGPPIFHDGSKSWGCSKTSHADWESFLSQPGCAVGRHQR